MWRVPRTVRPGGSSTRRTFPGPGSWVLGPGSRVPGHGSWVLGPGSWVPLVRPLLKRRRRAPIPRWCGGSRTTGFCRGFGAGDSELGYLMVAWSVLLDGFAVVAAVSCAVSRRFQNVRGLSHLLLSVGIASLILIALVVLEFVPGCRSTGQTRWDSAGEESSVLRWQWCPRLGPGSRGHLYDFLICGIPICWRTNHPGTQGR
jgi:hypothetical protein